ncbi:hypothetical protein ACFSVM_00550 [Paenibacillus shunpengii]|uniref:Uncharacterized protein n=1 Tax=Paenibacillus shunpengii TaxID=2054424 RepID=A0ABW5SI39_9BACL|nr:MULTISPECIES: hypothetical protein [unclassified Paenibacillus]OMC72323.1 hypothetical protein BK126_10140 [Paenibacillus sp. FSL H7-0326]
MMVDQILREVLDRRSQEIVEICEREHLELYKLFSETLENMREHMPEHLYHKTGLLEDLFLHSNIQLIKTAHKLGYQDAQSLKQWNDHLDSTAI